MSVLENKIWLIVCDMRKGLLLQNAGDAVYPKLELRAEFHKDLVRLPLYEIDKHFEHA
jgi:protein required for attachment to host cells